MLQHHPHIPTPPAGLAPRIKTEDTTQNYFYPHSNPIDNAAAAAAAAAGLIDPHNRDLHSALVASINNNVAAVNGTLTTAAVLKSQQQQQQQQQQQTQTSANIAATQQSPVQQQQQQQQQQNQQQQNITNNSGGQSPATQQAQAQQAAMALLNGTNATTNGGGGIVAIKASLSGRSTPSNSGGSSSDPAPGKLFVGGLSWQTSAEKLKEYFNNFGTVTDVLIMKDPVTQRSRGFGFITFQEPCSVDKVLKVPIHTLDGKKIDPKHATPKNRPRQSNKTKKIFVGGVSQDTSAEEVKAYFAQFGAVEETVMLMDQQTKRHRGFGFVTFENEDVVDRVCEIHFHTIKNKKVECKKAQPKEAVTPTTATQMLQKRLMLGTLGVQMPSAAAAAAAATAAGQLLGARTAAGVAGLNPLAMLQTPVTAAQLQQLQANGAVAAQQAFMSQNPFQVQNAAAANLMSNVAAAAAANQGGYGKLLTTYQPTTLHSVRYTPYSIPANAAAANALAQHQQAQQQHAAAAAAVQHHQHAAAAAAAAQQQQQQQHHTTAAGQATTATHNNAAALVAAAAGNGAGTGATATNGSLVTAASAQHSALLAANPLNAAAAAAAAAANPYQNYTLTNVDMSSFPNVDWNSVYGMGMYV